MLKLEGKYCKDCIIYTDYVEESAMSTIYSILDSEAFEEAKIRIMPDCHDGKGIVIGFTVPLGNYVCPSHVGVDIGCTVDLEFYNGHLDKSNYEALEYKIRKTIPFGMDLNNKVVFEEKEFFDYINKYYSKARSSWPQMIRPIGRIDEDFIKDMCRRIGIDTGTFYKSIGTVGGGNHYIEIGETPDGNTTVSVHCGSRNFGYKVCKYWESVAEDGGFDKLAFKQKVRDLRKSCKDKSKMPELIKDLEKEMKNGYIEGYLKDDDMKGYISDMVIATGYALFNHKIIHNRISKLMSVYDLNPIKTITTIHNYIDFNDHMLRKGSVKAYKDEEFLIPFNMRDGLAVCVGKSNPDWNYSCPHGAGRKMSRSAAKEKLSLDRFRDQMKEIYSTSVVKEVLDEAPDAYKDTNEIKSLITDSCDILYIIKPVINLKDCSGK